MEPSIDELRKNYKGFSDDKLIRLATTDAYGLRPEAIQVMQEEITNRGLSQDILKGIEAQRKPITEQELLEYCELLRILPCPICNSTSNKLNAVITNEVVSVVIATSFEDKLVIACPDCLDKAIKDATTKTTFLGWWGFPSGIYTSIKALNNNNKMFSQARVAGPNIYLKGFVIGQIGIIETNKANNEQLSLLIKHLS